MQTIQDARILIVDDSRELRNLLIEELSSAGYHHLKSAESVKSARQTIAEEMPELVILDINLPDGDGFSLFREIRAHSDVPILFLSARDADSDRLFGLGLGADDYLTKPFSVDELLARLRVALRRVRYDSQKTSGEAARYQNGGLVIDYAAGCAYRDGQELHLTPIEYKLLCLLAKNTGKVLTHNYIISEIWGISSENMSAELPSLRVFMATLRKKLEVDQSHPQYIQTHIGVGYRMIQCNKDSET